MQTFFLGKVYNNVSYLPAVSGSATNLDEYAPLVLKLTIITNLTNLCPIKIVNYGKRLRRLVIIVS